MSFLLIFLKRQENQAVGEEFSREEERLSRAYKAKLEKSPTFGPHWDYIDDSSNQKEPAGLHGQLN